MKKSVKSILYFFVGVALMASFHLLTRCEKDDDLFSGSISKEEQELNIDYAAIKEAVKQYQEAFVAGDQDEINSLTFDETVSYLDGNYSYSEEELANIGTAMSKAELSASSANYAEYTYSIDGNEFTFAMGLDDDGKWKLIRY